MAAPTKQIEMLKENVKQKFAEIRESLGVREKLLLRQIDVIATSKKQKPVVEDATTTATPQELRFITDNEQQLLAAIRAYGKFNLDSINLALHDLYLRNEDYIVPAKDHETMYKCLHLVAAAAEDEPEMVPLQELQPESIVVDFSSNKSLIERNVNNMNESIINITLTEAKELIRKAKVKREAMLMPPLNLEELDDECESSLAEAFSSLGKISSSNSNTECNTKSSTSNGNTNSNSHKSSQTPKAAAGAAKNKRCKPKITINNCNGTINLRNISNLTINCASEETLRAEIPLQHAVDSQTAESSEIAQNSPHVVVANSGNTTPTTSSSTTTTNNNTGSSSRYSSNASSRSQSKKHKCNKPTNKVEDDVDDLDEIIAADDAVHCEFYNRLLNEIKKTLQAKTSAPYLQSANVPVVTAVPVVADSSTDANSNVSSHRDDATPSVTQEPPPRKRLVLKNFENLKIILESNGDGGTATGAEETFHPVQIEQWLAEIISETDLEPMQNTDILEHSRIHNEMC